MVRAVDVACAVIIVCVVAVLFVQRTHGLSAMASSSQSASADQLQQLNALFDEEWQYELRTEPEVITVPGIPLDETLIELGGVSLLRMDVEGFEPMVIRGARRLIERSPDIAIVAEWSVPMMSIRVDLASFVEELEKSGFRAWQINGDARFVPVAMADLLTLPHCEVAFARIDLERFN